MGRVVAVVNEKGGVGKTTAVLECAYQAGAAGQLVLVVDCDAQANATRMLLGGMADGVAERLGLFDLMTSTRGPELAQVLAPAVDAWPSVMLVPADQRLGTIEAHLASRISREGILRRLLAPVREAFDLILLDLGPTIGVLTYNALVAADGYLVPTDLSRYSQAGMRTVRQVADMVRSSGANEALRFLGVFVAGFQKGISLSVRSLLSDLGDEYKDRLLETRIPHSVRVTDSQGLGQPVGRFAPDTPVGRSYRALYEELRCR